MFTAFTHIACLMIGVILGAGYIAIFAARSYKEGFDDGQADRKSRRGQQ